MAGIYTHIPFCKQACHYCDFHFSTSLKLKDELLLALQKEMADRAAYLQGQSLETIYFGGGTPSLLSERELRQLLEAIDTYFDMSGVTEITLEANPDDLSREKLRELKAAGINRLSIGTQSFREQDLRYLNRSHNAEQAIVSVTDAAALGFEHISLDLIYGIPELSLTDWEQNVLRAVELPINHLSCYGLTIEEGTVFGNWLKKGKLHVMDDDAVNAQFLRLMELAEDNGFVHYEISNFSKAGSEAVHNSNYWKGKHYLGIGPGAHSYDGKSRRWNVSHNAKYIKGTQGEGSYAEEEQLSATDQLNEYILTSIRTRWGINASHIRDTWGEKAWAPEVAEELQKQGLLNIRGDIVTLTRNGKLLTDSITQELII